MARIEIHITKYTILEVNEEFNLQRGTFFHKVLSEAQTQYTGGIHAMSVLII